MKEMCIKLLRIATVYLLTLTISTYNMNLLASASSSISPSILQPWLVIFLSGTSVRYDELTSNIMVKMKGICIKMSRIATVYSWIETPVPRGFWSQTDSDSDSVFEVLMDTGRSSISCPFLFLRCFLVCEGAARAARKV